MRYNPIPKTDEDLADYRGSIVHLTPATTYEVELAHSGPAAAAKTNLLATTWSENFPVGETVPVTGRTTPLAITELVRSDGIWRNWYWWCIALGGLLGVFFFSRLWRRANQDDWIKRIDAEVQSTVLFDTVAAYLTFSEDLLVMERLGVRVDEEGYTRLDPQAKALRCATAWKDLPAFQRLLVERLTGG